MLSQYSLEKIVYFCLAGLLFAGTNVLVALGYKSEMISTTKFTGGKTKGVNMWSA